MIYSLLKGRIGNNLFQIAAGYSLAGRLNTEFRAVIPDFILPEPDNCTLKDYLGQFRSNILREIKFEENVPPGITKYCESNDLSFRDLPQSDNIVLEGYFQSEKYFNINAVRNLFSIDNETETYLDNKYGDLLKENAVSINIRRGDFVKQPHLHPVCSLTYYRSAVRHFGNNREYMIISDDISWCRQKFRGSNFHFIDDEPPLIDLYLQAKCKDHIISNSSFSWWGAWLDPNPLKVVVAPANNWTGRMHPYLFSEDIYSDSWIRLNNPLDFKSRLVVSYRLTERQLVLLKKRILKF